MITYRIFIKNRFDRKDEPISICSHNPIPDATLQRIGNMTFEDASFFCRNILKASIWRGHPDREE